MKGFKGLLFAAAMLLALVFSCQSPTETPTDFTVTITGAALRQNASALDSVMTILENPFRKDTAKSDGTFSISFTSSAKSDVATKLTLTRPRFYDTTVAVTYGPSTKNVALSIVRMRATSSFEDSVVVRPSNRPGVIVLLGTSVKELSIRNAGGTDVATITFEVRDSSAVPVDANNQAVVGFRLITRPDASTYLSKDTARTSSAGTVTVQLTAGTTAGIAQVMAFATIKKTGTSLEYDTLRSPVISIPIHGGPPDSAHFSITSEKYNIAGGVKYNLQTVISALVGDKFGNPVQPGTVVQFQSNGGVIQSYGTTGNDGTVSAVLRSGEPIPVGGLVTITAQIGGSGLSALRRASAVAEKMSNDADVENASVKKSVPQPLAGYVAKSSMASELAAASGTFKRTLQVLFSGATRISVADTNFVVPKGGTKQVNFTVSDAAGNPLSTGTTVAVSAAGLGAGDVELSGDISKTLPDTKSPAYTAFRVFLRDNRTTGTDQTKPIDLRIEVASENGNMTAPVAGRLLGVSGSDSGRIGGIALVNSNPDSITVNGAGVSAVPIQFKVVDVFDKPAANIPVSFEFTKVLGGGEYLTPIAATTNANGIATTTLKGGIRSGVVQIVAKVGRDSISITSPAKTVDIRTGVASSIALISASSNRVSVQGGGGTTFSTLVFEARDTLGNAIDLANQTLVNFQLRGDTAGTTISPSPVTTDPATGRVVANFVSGTKSGIVQIFATARNGIIKSSPVSVVIQGGLPDSSHFSLVADKYNLAGGVKFGLKAIITVLLGDKYGNPVQPGTGVYFSSTGGLITSSGATADNGTVSVDLTTGEPVPPNGFALVKATIGSGVRADASALPKVLANFKRQKTETIDAPESAPMTFSKTIPILFSGRTQIEVADTNFLIPVGGTKQVNYRVSDPNGNPLSGGSTIKVTAAGQAAGDVELSGDIDKVLPDTWDPAFATFRVFMRDKRTTATDQVKPIDLRIDVVSDNGNATGTTSGRLLSTTAGSDSGKVGKIVLMNSDPDTVTVSGAGVATKVLQFKVLDVFDKPAANVPVNFEVTRSVNGGEYLTPQSAISDVNGLVATTITSGIRSGLVQVMAKAQAGTQSINSSVKSVYIKTGAVTNIVLVNRSSDNVSVRGGGGAESATLIFEARDTLGNAIDFANQTAIAFLLRGDTMGSAISPNPAMTDPATGRVVASFTSGTKSGIVQIFATAKSGLVKSSATSMSVFGGAPDSAHFSLVADRYNIAGAVTYGLRAKITALLADKYGNPVQPGTPVSFGSTGGTIQSSASTDVDGIASVDLISGEPVPSNGLVTVTATIGTGSKSEVRAVLPKVLAKFAKNVQPSSLEQAPNQYSRSLTVLFSGHTQIAMTDTNFLVPVGGTKQVNFHVADPNGKPLSKGTSIKVSATGDVQLTGDIDRVLPDTRDPAFTSFQVLVRDARTSGFDQVKTINLRVDVTGENDAKTASTAGRLLSLASGSDSGKVGKIDLVRTDPDTIAVNGGGGINTIQIQFRVSDVFDKPAPNIPVSFDVIRSVGGGESLYPISAMTDAGGYVSTVLKSGIRSGLVQLVARVSKDSVSTVSPAKTIYISTGPISSIALISISNREVSVRGVGGTESSAIVFEGRDSLGNPVDFSHQAPVALMVRGDTAGTRISPNPAMTDPVTGRIIANFSPGTTAGVVQVFATARGGAVTSAPVPISINGGFADQAHFTIYNPPLNISSAGIQFAQLDFTVVVGDKWSNPVKPGTIVYFSASGGVISGSAATGSDGRAKAIWQNVNPFPANGFLWIKARTIGESGQFVTDSVKIMYTGAPIVSFISPNVVNGALSLLDGAYADINYIVADLFGHPIALGNKILVSLSGPAAKELELTGNTSIDMPETIDTIAGTHYTFRVGDRSAGSGQGGAFTIKLSVDGWNGHMEKSISGTLYAPGDIIVPPSARKPAQIGYLGTTASEIYVSGVGATENATISYEVRDSLGVAISRSERTYATFELQFFPNTFAGGGTNPTLLPSADSTDDSGRLHVSVLSGSAAGVVQIRARIQTASGVIISEPVKISVHAGFPDQKHFTIAPSQYNFPGLSKAYVPQTITVQVGDRYSNPVQQGTAVYFNTAHGIITTGLTTDKNGFITNTLYSANPLPLGADTLQSPLDSLHHGPGFSRMFARTFGQSAAPIIDQVDILWTGPPIITPDPTSPITYTIGNGGNAGPFKFTVMDYLGHPMSAGTTITVSGDGLSASGDGVSVLMPDVMDSGPGLTSFTIMVEDADATTTTVPPKKSQLTLRVAHPVYGSYTRILATGTVQ
ncbi:MAG: hypothetical protein NTV54_04545 [Ignavibacteriales bacterium]|nr:hypothetical protein [Ignavibacteriales bacterium]